MRTIRSRRLLALALTLFFAFSVPPSARALNIQVSLGTTNLAATNPPDPALLPPGDPDGSQLLRIVTAAAEYWETIIKDPGTLVVTCIYNDNIGITSSAKFDNIADDGTRITTAQLRFRSTLGWWYDPTPTDHSEFNMDGSLIREFTAAQQASIMRGGRENVEVEFAGPAIAGGPTGAGQLDTFTYALHEIGHALSMTTQLGVTNTELSDGDFDFFPSMVNGALTAMRNDTAGGAHVSRGLVVNGVPTIFPLMNTSVGANNRRLPSAADVLAIATCPNPGWNQIDLPRKDFLRGGTTDWNTARNWIGNRLPDSADDVFVRLANSGGVFGVLPFPVVLSAGSRVDNLTVGDNSIVSTGSNKLDVDFAATIIHNGGVFEVPTIAVDPGGELEARTVSLQGGLLDLKGGLVDIGTKLTASTLGSRRSTVRGYGTIDVAEIASGTISAPGEFVNEGRLIAEGSNTLTLQTTGGAIWDLDGISGDGEVHALQGNINISGGSLHDPFSGEMSVGESHSIAMAEDWTLDGNLLFDGGSSSVATIGGGGRINFTDGVVDVRGRGQFLTPIDLRTSAVVTMDPNSSLGFGRETTFRGGSYTGDGTMSFDDEVTINAATTIDVSTVDLDGSAEGAAVILNQQLSLNVSQLDTTGSKFDGSLTLNGGFALLSVNGPPSWQMDGDMTVNGSAAFQFPMLSGAPVELSGTATVTSRSSWSAHSTISGTIAMGSDANDRLTLLGGSKANPNRIENGTIGLFGTLRLGSSAWLTGNGLIASITSINPSNGILADDGVLQLVRPPGLANNTTIGTADVDGILEITPAWTLPTGATLSMIGGEVRGGTVTIEGATDLSGAAQIAATHFKSGSTNAFAAGSSVTANGSTTIDAGAAFTDGGGALFTSNQSLTLQDGASLTVPSRLGGFIRLGIVSAIAKAQLTAPELLSSATLHMNISGAPASSAFDILTTTGTSRLRGTLQLEFNTPAAQTGDTWKIIDGDSLVGKFSSVTHTGLPSSLTPQPYYLADGVYIKLVREISYSQWSTEQGFPPGMNGFDDDPDQDGSSNGIEAAIGTNPLSASDAPSIEIGRFEGGGDEFLIISVERNAHTVVFNVAIGASRTENLTDWTANNMGDLAPAFDPTTCTETLTFFSKIPIADAPRQALRLEMTVFQ